MSTIEELLTDLNIKLEETWDDYDKAESAVRATYFLGKIRGIEVAIALLEIEVKQND